MTNGTKFKVGDKVILTIRWAGNQGVILDKISSSAYFIAFKNGDYIHTSEFHLGEFKLFNASIIRERLGVK